MLEKNWTFSESFFLSRALENETQVLLEDIERERQKTSAVEDKLVESEKERRNLTLKITDLESTISKQTRDRQKIKHEHEKATKEIQDKILTAVNVLGFKGVKSGSSILFFSYLIIQTKNHLQEYYLISFLLSGD